MVYLTTKEANELASSICNNKQLELWNRLTEERKAYLLKEEAIKLDDLPWLGMAVNRFESYTSWPRYLYGQIKECPDEIKEACLLGIIRDLEVENDSMLSNIASLRDSGVSSYHIKDASISFGTSSNSYNSRYNKNEYDIYSDIYTTYLRKYVY